MAIANGIQPSSAGYISSSVFEAESGTLTSVSIISAGDAFRAVSFNYGGKITFTNRLALAPDTDYYIWLRLWKTGPRPGDSVFLWGKDASNNLVIRSGMATVAPMNQWVWVKAAKTGTPKNYAFRQSDFGDTLAIVSSALAPIYVDKIMVTDDMEYDPNIPDAKAIIYQENQNQTGRELGLLQNNKNLSIPSNSKVSIYFAGPRSEDQHQAIRLATSNPSYIRLKFFKETDLIGDYIMKLGGTQTSYFRFTLPSSAGNYKVETYQCPIDVLADIDWSRHPYYSDPNREGISMPDSLDLFKMYQNYPEKYPAYSARCLQKTGVTKLRVDFTTPLPAPRLAYSTLSIGTCTMEANLSALKESSRGTPQPEEYTTTYLTCAVIDGQPRFSSQTDVSATRASLTFNTGDLIEQCDLGVAVDSLRGYEQAIYDYSELSATPKALFPLYPAGPPGGTGSLLGPSLQYPDCGDEREAAQRALVYNSLIECPGITRCEGIICELSGSAAAAAQAYYQCAVTEMMKERGSYLCGLSSGGIIPWQANFDGFDCSEENKINGLTARASYPFGIFLSLSLGEEDSFNASGEISQLNSTFSHSQTWYEKAYGAVKSYYDFKRLDFTKDVPTFKNFSGKQCSVRSTSGASCGELGHCFGINYLVNLFYHKGNVVDNLSTSIGSEEYNQVISKLQGAAQETGRADVPSLTILSTLNSIDTEAWCHIWQVEQSSIVGHYDTLPLETEMDTYIGANILRQQDSAYFQIISKLTSGVAPQASIYNPRYSNSHSIIVLEPTKGGTFSVFDSTEPKSPGSLTYKRNPNGPSYFIESPSFAVPFWKKDIPLNINQVLHLLNIDLKQKNCGQCYCDKVLCVSP